jgi:exonuclease III
MAINILTCNINGLNDQTKRDNFFGFLKKSSYDLILLQETKSGPSTVKQWGDEWTGESIWNSGPSHSCCGVAILSKSNISLTELKRDANGRILNAMIKIDEHEMQVLNIYAPNVPRERRHFFGDLGEFSQDTGLPVLLAGDFNMVESLPLDTEGTNNAKYHTYGISELGVFRGKYNLVDVFRYKFPTKREFTWRNQTVKCRLDRIYCPDKVAKKTTRSKILTNPFSDHEFVSTTVNFSQFRRGPGYWKLNCSLLEIEVHRQKIELLIQDWQTKKRSYTSILKWWDDCKLFVRAELQHISIQESAKNKKQMKRIENEIQREQQNANPNLDSIKEKRDALFLLQFPGAFIRTKQKQVNYRNSQE